MHSITQTSSKTADGGTTPDCQARPERPAGYWERVDRIVSAAPPLSAEQRAILRSAFHQPEHRSAAA